MFAILSRHHKCAQGDDFRTFLDEFVAGCPAHAELRGGERQLLTGIYKVRIGYF
jgi:hypothetical protein